MGYSDNVTFEPVRATTITPKLVLRLSEMALLVGHRAGVGSAVTPLLHSLHFTHNLVDCDCIHQLLAIVCPNPRGCTYYCN